MSRCPTCFREAIHVPGPDFMFASVSCPFQISFTLKQFLKGWVLDFSRKGEAWQYPFDMAVLPRGCLCLRAVHESTMWSLIDAPLEQDFHLLNPSLMWSTLYTGHSFLKFGNCCQFTFTNCVLFQENLVFWKFALHICSRKKKNHSFLLRAIPPPLYCLSKYNRRRMAKHAP